MTNTNRRYAPRHLTPVARRLQLRRAADAETARLKFVLTMLMVSA